MFFTRLYERRLAQASYIIGCQATGQAIVIDPNRDAQMYIKAAKAERLRITHVTETHIHADFVSGARELAKQTGAKLLLSGEGGADWQYAFASESKAQILHDGDSFNVGNLRFDVLHTPGHTPEHLSFLLTDVPASPLPIMLFSGDFVFVGDVGRPDLLEKAANQRDTMVTGARDLWKSFQKFRALPDFVQLQPGHGAGSACGKALGAVPSSTVGYEKLVNWAFAAPNEDVFIAAVLEGQPEPPAYFAHMKRVNKEGPALLGERHPLTRLDATRAAALQKEGATLIDVRTPDAFVKAHPRGAITIFTNRSFTTYAGSVVPLDRPVVLITDEDGQSAADDAARELQLIGIDRIEGFIPASALTGATDSIERIASSAAIEQRADGVPLVDVRNSSEWATGHVPGAKHIPFPQFVARMKEFPRDTPFMVMCESGARSTIAASVLRNAGYPAIDAGGIVQWERAGGSIVTG